MRPTSASFSRILFAVALGLSALPLSAQLSAGEVADLVARSGVCNVGWELQCTGSFCSTVCQSTGKVGAVTVSSENPTLIDQTNALDTTNSVAPECDGGWQLQCNGGTCCTVCQATGKIGDCSSAN